MTDRATDRATEAMTSREAGRTGPRSVLRVLSDQRKTLAVAMALAVVMYWIAVLQDAWVLAACTAGGIALGMVNHLSTEYWLLRIITSGRQPTRNNMIVS